MANSRRRYRLLDPHLIRLLSSCIFLSQITLLSVAHADSLSPSSSELKLLQVPNFCNDCAKAGCLNDGKCRSDDGRCECQQGFWGNRCQYKTHEMYKFGQCPTPEVLGTSSYDWPQLQPDGCHVDSDCPGLWKCCPSFVATEDQKDRLVHSPVGTRSCTQPWLEAPLVAQLPLCLQHLWNVTDAGRTFGGCDVLMCDESTGGRGFDRWQCNYCEANATTCFCFINFDNEGKYWGELPGSRQKLSTLADVTTDRPGVIHRMPKHDCSLQDRCPQMFPHSIYCSHGIQRDASGCPTGDCLPNPEDKCFTPCSAGFLCEHRPEPEQVNHWHCIDTFRQFRVTVPLPARLAYALRNDMTNVSAKATELVALNAIVDDSIVSLLNSSSTQSCERSANSRTRSALRATTAANAYLLPLQDNPSMAVIEIVGQVAFSANFSGAVVRRALQMWMNETYYSKMIDIGTKLARSSSDSSQSSSLGVTAIALITVACILTFFLLVVGIPLYIYRQRLFTTTKLPSFLMSTSRSNASNNQAQIVSGDGSGVFSAFTNPTHRYSNSGPNTGVFQNPENNVPRSGVNNIKLATGKSRPAPLPPTVVALPDMSSSSSSGSSDDGSMSPNNIVTPPATAGPQSKGSANEGYQAF